MARRSDADRDEPRRRVAAALHDRLVARVREAGDLDRLVELCCGSGLLTLQLAESHPDTKITGLDSSTDHLRKATAAATELQIIDRVDFERTDLVTLPLPDATADLIVGARALTRTSNPRVLLSEISRILRPGARAILVDDIPETGHTGSRRGTLLPSLSRPGTDEETLRTLINTSALKDHIHFARHPYPPDGSFLELTLNRPVPPKRERTSWRMR